MTATSNALTAGVEVGSSSFSYVSIRTSSATVAATGVGFEASSLMVPVAAPFDSEIVALSGLLRVTVKVSSSSSIVSGVVWTVKVLVVSLAEMVRVVAGPP